MDSKNNILLFILLYALIMQSCVSQKVWVREELEERFEDNYEEFMQEKGVEDNQNLALDVFFDEREVENNYEVITYNEVIPALPFSIFYRSYWWNKYRLHTFLHHAYCTGLWEYADGFIAEPEMGTIKFIRYAESDKPIFEGMSSLISNNKSLLFGTNINTEGSFLYYIHAGYSIGKTKNCMYNIRRDFIGRIGMNSNKIVELELQPLPTSTPPQSNKITQFILAYDIQYRWIHSYAISEYLSNAFNKNTKIPNLFFELGPVINVISGRYTTIKNNEGKNKISSAENFYIDGYLGLKYNATNKIGIIVNYEIPLFSLESIFTPQELLSSVDIEATSVKKISLTIQYNLTE